MARESSLELKLLIHFTEKLTGWVSDNVRFTRLVGLNKGEKEKTEKGISDFLIRDCFREQEH